MSLKRTVQSAVNKAFNAAGDLKEVGTLQGPKITGYDLEVGAVVEKPSSSTQVDVIVTQSNKQDDSTTSYSAMIKSGPDLSVYKTIKINKKVYKLGTYTDNGFVIEINLMEE
jgi:hypothetical protein